jgi:pimeloyl-ACP methyl ester carboxylesterase
METKFMQKNFTVQGIKLAYLEKNPHEKKCIFFIHGNSGSSLTWSKQLESPLFSDFRIIAFDLPAHGSSESSPNPDIDYSPIILGKIMAQAVKSLAGDQSYILAGFSFGTNVIGEMLSYDLKPAGIILVSSCVISSVTDLQKVFLPNPNAGNFFIDSFSREGLDKLALDCFFLQNNMESEKFKYDFENTTAPFRSILMKKAGEGAVSDEIEFLRKTGLPILTIFGNEDKIVNINYLDAIPFTTWQNTIYKLPEAGHFVHIDQSELLNQLIFDYAIEMVTIGHA